MTYLQVRDVIERIEAFRRHLEEKYREEESLAGDERLRMLLARLRSHEDQISRQLDELDENSARGVLETWIQNVPETLLELPEIDDGVSQEELVAQILEQDQVVVDLFRQLADSRLPPRVQELFESLYEVEKAKLEELSRQSPSLQ